MEKKNILSKIKFREIIYPAITVVFFAALLLFFIMDIQFITQNINKIFYIPNQAEIEAKMTKVDLVNYSIVAKKLGISAEVAPQAQAPAALAPQVAASSTTSTSTQKIISGRAVSATTTPRRK